MPIEIEVGRLWRCLVHVCLLLLEAVSNTNLLQLNVF